MAWNPSPKVADCREIARKWGMKQVIIIGMTDDQIAMATYGETKAMCADAKRLGDHAYQAVMDHYEDDTANAANQPERNAIG
jgi:hypothetical protein